MELAIISGRSGSGKTTALQVLEDLDFYCVDNLPISLLTKLVEQVKSEAKLQGGERLFEKIAVGIDARNLASQLESFPAIYDTLLAQGLKCKIIYLDSQDEILIRRFSTSRRKHPLSNQQVSLAEAIAREERYLKPIENLSSLSVDTSNLTVHQLRETIKQEIFQSKSEQTSILIQSFSFKHGLPIDADFVFDARCLPNPHWEEELRELTGQDDAVVEFLDNENKVAEMLYDIEAYLKKWIPEFEANNRSYLTVAIGCTGGKHRSVYLAEKLAINLKATVSKTQIRHRELSLNRSLQTK